ncbi:MAG: hypothetical protein ACXVZV_12980, partial [Terriglobales bacterium]
MRFHVVTSTLVLAVLSLAMSACSGAPNSGSSDQNNPATTSSTNAQSAPFSGSTTQNSESSEHKGFFSRESSVPDNLTVPAGTVVNVRLQQNSISSASASAGQSFDAVLDEPLVVNGKTVAPRGAAVTGRVVEAKSSGRLHDSGYLRLTLSAITLNGKSVP